MDSDLKRLQALGWGNDFLQQLTLEQLEHSRPARVVSVARDHFHVNAGEGNFVATLSGHYRFHHQQEDSAYPTTGDWVLLHPTEAVILERLGRRNLIARKAAGSDEIQAIAANIDLLLIISGLDEDFNLHRIERYLVLAAQSRVTPIVILTKADLCADPQPYLDAVRERLPPQAAVFAVNALSDPLTALLAAWLQPGTTLSLVGSSGVGKSTLVNNLLGSQQRATAATGESAKGRHTTTSRDLIPLPGGACIIDVPGMREVGLAPTAGGVATQFRSLAELASHCRFKDCRHENEPGCAVREAVARGELDPDEWQHYLTLLAEERRNIAEHEKRREGRVFGRMVKEVKAIKRRQRHEE